MSSLMLSAHEPGKPASDVVLTLMGYTQDRIGSGIWYGSDGNFYKTDDHHGEFQFHRSWYRIPKDEVLRYIEKLKKRDV